MDGQAALNLTWVFSFNEKTRGSVHSLCTEQRNALFYVAAHTGVIYDYASRTQMLLQGHRNPITCATVSTDKRWIVTADAGPDSLLVVWDSMSATPVKSIVCPHEHGVAALDMSGDAMHIVTISQVQGVENEKQYIAVWEWTEEAREEALHHEAIPSRHVQCCVRFNPRDSSEIVTNGAAQVLFWTWDELEMTLYTPRMSKKEAHHASQLTVSCFVDKSTLAVTGTADGRVIMWDVPYLSAQRANNQERLPQRAFVKSIQLCQGMVAHLGSIEGYICVAGQDGAVRYYDHQFRIEGWFEDINAGSVTSVSFATTESRNAGPGFHVPDFVVGTELGYIVAMQAHLFDEIDADNRKGTVLVQGLNDEVHCVATHPTMDRLLITCYNCSLQLWDYDKKVLLMVRNIDKPKLKPQCAAFDPSGRLLVVGFTTGQVRFMEAESLTDLNTYDASEFPILFIRFSMDGKFMAVAEGDCHVALWAQKDTSSGEGAEVSSPSRSLMSPTARALSPGGRSRKIGERNWMYVGRHRSHTKAITGLEFSRRENGQDALISVGEDRKLVEYDLINSSVENGLLLAAQPHKIEQMSVPSACTWHPRLDGDNEDRIIVANTDGKLKQWNADNMTCRFTCLAPSFGGPVKRLLPVAASATVDGAPALQSEYFAWQSVSKVIGLLKAPLDGNPDKWMGLIAHPTDVASVAISRDGKLLFSAGGADRTVMMWSVSTSALDVMEAKGRGTLAPYLRLLEGGPEGPLHQELQDYFYYSQLKIQGEDTTSDREAPGYIPLTEIPSMMRALGFFPTEAEINNMVNEVKYRDFTKTGEVVSFITLEEFIKLYVNHRPSLDVEPEDIERAFKTLQAEGTNLELEAAKLLRVLQTSGEPLDPQELKRVLQSLTGETELRLKTVSANGFITDVLGFEDPNAAKSASVVLVE